jgi:hypothetical protein
VLSSTTTHDTRDVAPNTVHHHMFKTPQPHDHRSWVDCNPGRVDSVTHSLRGWVEGDCSHADNTTDVNPSEMTQNYTTYKSAMTLNYAYIHTRHHCGSNPPWNMHANDPPATSPFQGNRGRDGQTEGRIDTERGIGRDSGRIHGAAQCSSWAQHEKAHMPRMYLTPSSQWYTMFSTTEASTTHVRDDIQLSDTMCVATHMVACQDKAAAPQSRMSGPQG